MALQAAHGSFLLYIHHEEHRLGVLSEPKNDAWLINSLWSPVFTFHSLSVYFILPVAWLLQWIKSLFELHISSLSTELPLSTLRVLPLLKIVTWTLQNYVTASLCASSSFNIHNWIPSLLRQRDQGRHPHKLSILAMTEKMKNAYWNLFPKSHEKSGFFKTTNCKNVTINDFAYSPAEGMRLAQNRSQGRILIAVASNISSYVTSEFISEVSYVTITYQLQSLCGDHLTTRKF
jgi:hypothetical protein